VVGQLVRNTTVYNKKCSICAACHLNRQLYYGYIVLICVEMKADAEKGRSLIKFCIYSFYRKNQ